MASLTLSPEHLPIHIVYHAAGVSGKTTNLLYIHSKLAPHVKSDLTSQMIRNTDRQVFFDFVVPEVGKVGNKTPLFRLDCVPGCVYYSQSRYDVLTQADAVVFVADSQIDRLDANTEVLNDMLNILHRLGHKIERFPWVIQYNKRDLSNIASVEELQQQLNPYCVPYFEAIATQGIGVFDTLKAVIDRVVPLFRERHGSDE